MYLDFHRFIDNSDYIITLDTLMRRTRRAMTMTYDELRDYCQYEINYWKQAKVHHASQSTEVTGIH